MSSAHLWEAALCIPEPPWLVDGLRESSANEKNSSLGTQTARRAHQLQAELLKWHWRVKIKRHETMAQTASPSLLAKAALLSSLRPLLIFLVL